MLRFFPSGTVYHSPLLSWLMLGRAFAPDQQNVLDLTRFDAHNKGVSRQHAVLRRRDTHLVVSDMGSTNGTFLNGEQLEPGKEYVVRNGDHLSLGMLMLAVFFGDQMAD